MTSAALLDLARPALRRAALACAVGGVVGGGVLVGAPPTGPPGRRAGAVAVPMTVGGLELTAAHPQHPRRGHPWHRHAGRWILPHTVRRGETATGLAVRYHAWTDELMALNHLRKRAVLYVGEHLRIPVVLSAWRRDHARPRPHRHGHGHRHHQAGHHDHRHRHRQHWRNAGASRTQVRHTVVRTAHRHGVNPDLALAIAWHESGWQQHVVSSAHAVGVMQVLPSTGRWMSAYVGRRLNVYGMHDNVTAGVVLVRVLRGQTGPRRAIGAYYQGLGSVRRHGMFHSTRHYVATVRALKHRLAHGWRP